MLSEAIGDLTTPAMAVALSPFPIVAIALVLGGPGGLRVGAAFSAGWVAGLGGMATLLLLAASELSGGGAGGAQILFGLFLLAAAWRTWRKRCPDGPAKAPAWIGALEAPSATRAALIGAGLGGLNPKNIAIASAAVAAILGHGLAGSEAALALTAFTLIASSTVLGAFHARAIGGRGVEASLDRLKRFMIRNADAIVIVVLLLVGAKLLADGLAALLA